MKNCLVTGGAGYVGSHCCKELAKAGYSPVTADNLFRGHRAFVKWGPLCVGDTRDGEFLDAVFQEYDPIAVFHFAGLTYVGESTEKPGLYYSANTVGTLSLLEAMRRGGCDNIIFSSTAAVYGDPKYSPLDENHPKDPINPYGRSKLFVEKILADYESAHGIKYTSLRYFNASGADEGGEIGERHSPETHLIPLIIDAALGRRDAIKIFGADYPTNDGTAVRDYIHVTDLAAAHIKAMERMLAGGGCKSMNLGTGEGNSVLDVIESVRRVSGKSFVATAAPRRAGDPPFLTADPSEARKTLDWDCRYKDIDDIVRTAWHWHLK